MFRRLNIKAQYIVPNDNIAKDFYNPILKYAVKYDRTTAYFSAKSLAMYSQGLEFFASNITNKFRLIVSHEISHEDYILIKEGYELKETIKNQLLSSFNEELNLSEKKNLSNLAYLISIGIVDIKIAFVERGLFHEKGGIFYDCNDNVVYFNGSANETEQGLTINYETISVYCSLWDSTNTPYFSTIKNAINNFEVLWNNKHDFVKVFDAYDFIINSIQKYNQNRIIYDENYFLGETIIFDFYKNQLIIVFNTDKFFEISEKLFYKTKIEPYINFLDEKTAYLKDLSIKTIIDIDNLLLKKANDYNLRYIKTKELNIFIEETNLNIKKRSKIGTNIKNKEEIIKNKFYEYKKILCPLMARQLREQQLWDSFFMYTMKKSANFSVPGSGKTSSVLGVYAVLNSYNDVKRIVVICPKNSFVSWIDEFKNNFGNLINLSYFSVHSKELNSFDRKKMELKYNDKKYNLFLFNYESINNYKEQLIDIISSKTLLVFDEVHKIKKIDGSYAKTALDLSKNSVWTIVMTGTPIPNRYSDIYNILNILFPYDYKDFFNFSIQTLKNPEISDIDNINNKLYPFFCRTTKKQLDVPPPNNDICVCHKASIIEEQILKILFNACSKNKLLLFIRILQLETNPQLLLENISSDTFKDIFDEDFEDVDLSETKDFTSDIKELVSKIDLSSKKHECIKLIKKLVNEGKSIILWCIFKDTINSFNIILKNMGIASQSIYGDIALEERQIIINNFKNGAFFVLITNPHTLAESISLHNVCHDAIYFEYSYNLVHLLQSKDRIHRLGLSKNQYTQWYFMWTQYKINNNDYCLNKSVYEILLKKEQVMIESIEGHKLETPTTSKEDLDLIFKHLDSITSKK